MIFNFSDILRISNGTVVIHINPKICGFNKRTITRKMGIPDYDYQKWLNETRSIYSCELLIEFKFTLF